MTPPGAPAAATDRHEHVDVLEGAAEVAHLTRLASSVRHHQRLMARAFLALLADRRGWAS